MASAFGDARSAFAWPSARDRRTSVAWSRATACGSQPLGVAIGLVCALAVARVLRGLLYDVSANRPADARRHGGGFAWRGFCRELGSGAPCGSGRSRGGDALELTPTALRMRGKPVNITGLT
jgi:hypothetical protein